MTAAQMYLPQVLGLVALSFLTALAILISRIADRCRQRVGDLGATLSSSSMLANRRIRRCRATCMRM